MVDGVHEFMPTISADLHCIFEDHGTERSADSDPPSAIAYNTQKRLSTTAFHITFGEWVVAQQLATHNFPNINPDDILFYSLGWKKFQFNNPFNP